MLRLRAKPKDSICQLNLILLLFCIRLLLGDVDFCSVGKSNGELNCTKCIKIKSSPSLLQIRHLAMAYNCWQWKMGIIPTKLDMCVWLSRERHIEVRYQTRLVSKCKQ